MNEVKQHMGLHAVTPLAAIAVLAFLAAWDGALVKWVALDAVPFVAFWASAATLVVLAVKTGLRIAGADEGGCTMRIAFLAALLVALAVVVAYSCVVIAPVAAVPSGDQTGIGCIWLVSSVIAAMIALPVMSYLLESL